jgi:hypothetical protein
VSALRKADTARVAVMMAGAERPRAAVLGWELIALRFANQPPLRRWPGRVYDQFTSPKSLLPSPHSARGRVAVATRYACGGICT